MTSTYKMSKKCLFAKPSSVVTAIDKKKSKKFVKPTIKAQY